MKYIINLKMIVSAIFVVCLFACNEDKGNYDYTGIARMDSINKIEESYVVELGERLKITPELETFGGNLDDFDYTWYYQAEKAKWNVLQEGKDLDFVIAAPLGSDNKTYTCAFEAVNKKTQISYRKIFSIKVAGDFGRGYVVLYETETGFDMSMIVLNAQNQFVPKLNILESVAPALQREGVKPHDICIFVDRTAPHPYQTDGSGRSVYLLTDQYTTRLKSVDFSWDPSYDISNVVESNSPFYKEFVASGKPAVVQKMKVSFLVSGSSLVSRAYAYMKNSEEKGDWYVYSTYPTWLFFSYPMNDIRATNGGQRYEPAPFLSNGSFGTMFFDVNKNQFYYQTLPNGPSDMGSTSLFYTEPLPDETNEATDQTFNFNTPNEGLLYMSEWYTSGTNPNMFAILKQSDGTFKYIEWRSLKKVGDLVKKENKTRLSRIEASSRIDKAKFFAPSPAGPFLYYVTEDNKVYYADVSNATARVVEITDQVVPEGYGEITAFKFMVPSGGPASKSLGVATYNSSLGKDAGGRIDFFTTKSTTGALEKTKHKVKSDEEVEMSWSGFGKIVSMDYKP